MIYENLFSDDFDSPIENKELSKLKIRKIQSFLHTCVLTEEGKVYLFGDNRYYQLGNYSKKWFIYPFQLTLPIKFVDIAVDSKNTYLVDENGRVHVTGLNNHGQLGNQISIASQEFTILKQLKNHKIVKCYSGNNSIMYLSNNGHVFPFGNNSNGRLGIQELSKEMDKNTNIDLNEFSGFDTFTTVKNVSIGGSYTFFSTREIDFKIKSNSFENVLFVW